MRRLTYLWIVIAGLFFMNAVSCSRPTSTTPIVGTWKGTDEYGHEHYLEFGEDGKLTWWDMDRSIEDGTFTKRGPFRGSYRRNRNGSIELTDGVQSLGVLTGGATELQQDDSGHAMRQRLTYKKVDAK